MTIRSNMSLPLYYDDSYLWSRLHPYIKEYISSSVTTPIQIVATNDKIEMMKNCKSKMEM